MNKESLEIVQDKVVNLLNNTNIDIVDKVELLINLVSFLNPDEYDENIKILQKKNNNDII